MWAGADDFGRIAVAISYLIHGISALIMLFGIFLRLYQSTWTIQGMMRGTVSEACTRR